MLIAQKYNKKICPIFESGKDESNCVPKMRVPANRRGSRGRRFEKMNGTGREKGERRGILWNISLVRRASNAQLQTPTIGSWSWLTKSAEIGATARSAFPNVFFSRFLRQPATFQPCNEPCIYCAFLSRPFPSIVRCFLPF